MRKKAKIQVVATLVLAGLAFTNSAMAENQIGLFFNPQGTQTELSAAPMHPFDVYLVAGVSGVAGGVLAWECAIECPANVQFLETSLSGQALNYGQAHEYIVGLGAPLVDDETVVLARFRCQVTDEQPARFIVKPIVQSSVRPPAPVFVTENPDNGLHLQSWTPTSSFDASASLVVNGSSRQTAFSRGSQIQWTCPNPFNPQTMVHLNLAESGPVVLAVYSVDGLRIRILLDDEYQSGHQVIRWDGRDQSGLEVSSGTYFVRLVTESGTETKKVMLIR